MGLSDLFKRQHLILVMSFDCDDSGHISMSPISHIENCPSLIKPDGQVDGVNMFGIMKVTLFTVEKARAYKEFALWIGEMPKKGSPPIFYDCIKVKDLDFSVPGKIRGWFAHIDFRNVNDSSGHHSGMVFEVPVPDRSFSVKLNYDWSS